MFMKGEHSDRAVEFFQNLEPKEWLYCWSCLESLCIFKKSDCVQPQYWWDNMNAKPVALLGKLGVQQGKERVERTEKHSQVCQA